MLLNQLTLAYECLSAIGNSLALDSMILELMSSFSRKTGAINARYYADKKSSKVAFSLGKKIDLTFDRSAIENQKYILVKNEKLDIIILPLRNSYLVFVYKNQKNIEQLASILGNFQNKINLSISACLGVLELQTLNDKLEYRVENTVNNIREKEKMLLAQSKQAVMGEMIEMIAHQWRQPLTTIGMIANNITMDVALDALNIQRLQDDLSSINTQVNHLSSTIDDFRNFFKESKEKEDVSSVVIMEAIHSLVYQQLRSQNISIVITTCDEMLINVYKNELIQVILNLISNAKDALLDSGCTQENKMIQFQCKNNEDSLEIIVLDNAGGIDKAIIAKIFEPYFSTKKEKNGTGLGLYMSKTIIEEHLNGKISFENVKDGASFKIVLPRNNV